MQSQVVFELFLCARSSNCSNQKTLSGGAYIHAWCSQIVAPDVADGNTPDQMEINPQRAKLKKRSWMLKRRKYVQQWRQNQGQGI
jgi:hypothetical protein